MCWSKSSRDALMFNWIVSYSLDRRMLLVSCQSYLPNRSHPQSWGNALRWFTVASMLVALSTHKRKVLQRCTERGIGYPHRDKKQGLGSASPFRMQLLLQQWENQPLAFSTRLDPRQGQGVAFITCKETPQHMYYCSFSVNFEVMRRKS